MKIYVLLKQGHEGKETVRVSEDINKICTSICKHFDVEDINKIRISICEDFDENDDYYELEIWYNGEMVYKTSGNDVLKKIKEEINKRIRL